MSASITPQMWWQLPINEFPQAFRKDQHTMEKRRLASMLSANDGQETDNPWDRLRRAATLLEISALEKESLEEPVHIWELIALIHEAIGIIEQERKDYQWLLSSLTWQLAGSPAVADLLARKLSEQASYPERDLIERIAVIFSLRDFFKLRQLADLALKEGESLRQEFQRNGELASLAEAASLQSIGTAMRGLTDYTGTGKPFLDAPALEDFLKITQAIGDSRRFRVGRLLAKCVNGFISASSQMIVGQLPSLTDAARRNIFEYLHRYPELWPSQREAIAKGLLNTNKKHFVVAVPTSAGKTLCGELAIIQSLSDVADAICFYVVPTRALVEEKSKELKRKLEGKFKFRVAAATSALQQDEIEAALLGEAQVIVCTPEKLDLFIRHNDVAWQRANLFVIDESHLIDEKDRGLGIEFVVIKLLMLKPEAKLLLLSAMLPNSEDFGRWLAQDSSVCSSSWRPTRQRFGDIEFRQLKPRGSLLEITIYGAEKETDDLVIPTQQYSRMPRNLPEEISLAVEALRKKGPVLIFCMKKERCEKIVEELVKERKTSHRSAESDRPTKEIEALRQKIKREVADEFLLSEALAFRIAYHHADLPSRIRVELESLIEEGRIDVIASTTTLAEGVNLPISTVIFEDWMWKVDARNQSPKVDVKSRLLDLSKFRNIAGRAGRAHKETEGLALFLSPSRKSIPLSDGKSQTPREYFVRQEYPPTRSRFLNIIENYPVPTDNEMDAAWENGESEWKDSEIQKALRQFGIAVLHAMQTLTGQSDEEIIARVIDLSLLAAQAPEKKEIAKQWFGRWVSFYRRVQVEREELRPIAMQVGLPLRSVQRLYARCMSRPEMIELFRTENSPNQSLSEKQIEGITKIIAEIDELDWFPTNAPHQNLLAAWINGASIRELSKLYEPSLLKKERVIEKTCNYAMQKLSNSGAWGAYALARVLELILGENLSPVAKRLPLLVYFGVRYVPAALFCLMGIERIDSLRLGAAVQQEGFDSADVPMLRAWAEAKGIAGLQLILKGNDEREVDPETLSILGAE